MADTADRLEPLEDRALGLGLDPLGDDRAPTLLDRGTPLVTDGSGRLFFTHG